MRWSRRSKRVSKNGYEARSFFLHQMGFSSYAEYLDSDLWATIRRRALVRDRHRCRACGRRAFQVHHRAYSLKALLGLDLGPLLSICEDCHEWAERTREGKKRSLEMANKRLDCRIQALMSRRDGQASGVPLRAAGGRR